jgi:hypothetical protein
VLTTALPGCHRQGTSPCSRGWLTPAGIVDRQAAHAVRARIDGKYLLGLDPADPGFDFTC